jgi:hypothetical protein
VPDNYGLVLGTVIVTICWTAAAPNEQWARVIVGLLQATTLFGAMRASSVEGRTLRITVAVWVITAVAAVTTTVAPSEWTTNLSAVLGVLLILAALIAILSRLRAQPTVQWNTVQGAIAAYLMIGLLFAYTYSALNLLGPKVPLNGIHGETLNQFLYFSFITLATVGYGDITPVTDLARSIAMTEALLGQIYLVTVIGVLVSSAPRRRRPTDQHPADPHPADPHPVDPHPADPHPADPHPADPPSSAQPTTARPTTE